MQTETKTEDTIDLKELFFSLINQWKLIILCIIFSAICALIYLKITPETYQVNALVQVDDGKGASAALLGDLSSMIDQKQPAQTEIEILKSRLVLGNAIQNLNLNTTVSGTQNSIIDRLFSPHQYRMDYQKNEIIFFDDAKSFKIRQFVIPSSLENTPLELRFNQSKVSLTDPETKILIAEAKLNQSNEIRTPDGIIKLAIYTQDQFDEPYIIEHVSLSTAIDNLLKNFSVAEKGKLTGILTLNYEGQNPEQIRKVLNEILTVYNLQNIEINSAETSQTLRFLDEQLPQLKNQLDRAERQFNDFREKFNTVDINKESELYLSQSVALETQKVELEQKVAEVGAKYTNDHPAMQQMNAQLVAVNAKLAGLEKTLKQLPDLQRRYLQLYREVEVKNQLYTNLLNSYQQLRIAKAGEIGNVRIVDKATLPLEPIKPKKLMILILSLFVGGFIGVLLALLRNMLRSGIRDVEQLELEFDLPVYATIPHSTTQVKFTQQLKKKKNIPILAVNNNDDIAIESLRSMRTVLYMTARTVKNNIINISASAPNVGKSFVSINLATILAQSNKRILVIDADMRRSYLHKYCKLENNTGLSQYLTGQQTLENSIRPTYVDQLDIMTAGQYPKNPAELLHTTKFAEMLTTLSPQYDYIIIDTPPILAVTDASIISQHAGTNLIVSCYAQTQMKELKLTINRFNQVGTKIDGFILNNIAQNFSTYGYGYQYTYEYKLPKNTRKQK